jgi:glucose/arabinose dehydrogenase
MLRKMRLGLAIGAAVALPLTVQGQVTHGKKPELPAPFVSKSVGNAPESAKPPAGFLPTAPAGFRVNVFAENFNRPRWMAVAPNGDIFVAEIGANQVDVLRDPEHTGGAREREVFASGLTRPFGIAFHENYVYIGNTGNIVRFKYDPKTSKRLGEAEKILDVPPGGGHFTRSVAFSKDGKHLFVSVGSEGNIETDDPPMRAAITICDPDGKNARLYATGLRNPVGLAIEPVTGKVWTAVNERDELGDDLPPDYLTSVKDGGFYGWPYAYIGSNPDPRVKPQKPELVAKTILPDVLLGPHVAPLQIAFYEAKAFPEKYHGGVFVAEHGSWNRSKRNGYQVAFVGFKNGEAEWGPEPFLTGFLTDPTGEHVNGRPVGVAVAPDGALLVSDDGAGVIYRVSVAK